MDNVELVRWGFGAGASRFFSLLDDDVELDAVGDMVFPGTRPRARGRELVEQYCRQIWGTWAEYSAEPRECVAAGDQVVVEVHERGRGRGSGVPVERVHFQVWTLREGRLVRWALFTDRAEALASVGL